MKDKYDKCFYENERKNSKKEKIKGELLKLKYYLHIFFIEISTAPLLIL